MAHKAIEQLLGRAEEAKTDSDFAYFNDLLLAAEALAKTITAGMLAAVSDDKDRNRYRIEHTLVRSDGLGEWSRVLEDILTGPASQYLLSEAYREQSELAKACGPGSWQHEAVQQLHGALMSLSLSPETIPHKTDMKRWFRLLATLRNKTKAHGAYRSSEVQQPALALERSLHTVYENFSLFQRSWVHLYRNLSGKYRVSRIAGEGKEFDYLRSEPTHSLSDGIYLWWGAPKLTPLISSTPELDNFFFANGGFKNKTFEVLSYLTGDRREEDASTFLTPPGVLPGSQTQARGDLTAIGNCLTNAPDPLPDYVPRPELEKELLDLLLDDRRPIVTLRGRGGIGKTSLALQVLRSVFDSSQYMTVVWLSARDVDLEMTGPKPVRPDVVSPEDIGNLYADLVLSPSDAKQKGFSGRSFFEQELRASSTGPCLFVMDNFETTQNPIEMFKWLDTYIRPPNKILITTRLREFKGDYPVEVSGMTSNEARQLIDRSAAYLGIGDLLTEQFIEQLIERSEGHPYVIRILLGEVAKNKRLGSVPRLIAGSEDVLTALFERTYAALSPCAQRALLTLAAWNSSVPRLALEAVLLRSTQERLEVEEGVEQLIQFSLAEEYRAQDEQEFLTLPLVAASFGKRKLNVSPYRAAVQSDVEVLQMLGPSRREDVHLGLARKLETFVSTISKRVESGTPYSEYESILEMICRNYPPGWLVLGRWHLETGTAERLAQAQTAFERYLEAEPYGSRAADAWRLLARACYLRGDAVGELHALVQRSQLPDIPLFEVSTAANRFNSYLHEHSQQISPDVKQSQARSLLAAMEARKQDADSDDLSRMAWLAIHLGQDGKAQTFVRAGLQRDRENIHCLRLADRLGLSIDHVEDD